MTSLPREMLTPPRISKDYIKQKITGIRPMRDGSLCLHAETKNQKLLVHDYGHGGSGFVLLLGSVNESLRRFEQVLETNPSFKDKPICVIGAGCIGLLTAVRLAEKGYTVRMVAKDFTGIVSDYAGGASWMVSTKIDADYLEITESIASETWKEYLQALEDKHDFFSSDIVKLVPVYCHLHDDSGLESYRQKGLVSAPTEVLVDFGNGKEHPMLKYAALFINTNAVMQELQARVQALKIPCSQAEIFSFTEVPEEVIFNCAGLGAGALNNDSKMIPVQGHLLTLKEQPSTEQLQYIIYTKIFQNGKDCYLYYIPKGGHGCVGGTFIEGESGLDTNEHEFDLILQRAQEYFGNT